MPEVAQERSVALATACGISLAVDLSAIADASLWLRETGKGHGLSGEDTFRLDLCLSELVTNIVSNAGTEPGAGVIDIRARIDDESVAVEVRDNGSPFNPLAAAFRGASPLADAAVGGYGIHLVRSFAQKVGYERCSGENVLTFVVERDVTATAP
jgi:anti-sigma regulatory factor (Ser/Thr protein kinase)